jgi:hypothetical protein
MNAPLPVSRPAVIGFSMFVSSLALGDVGRATPQRTGSGAFAECQ